MSLDAHVEVALGSLELNADVVASEGATIAILGPNGAGKTTLLRALSGLQPLDRGHVVLDGEMLDDGDGVFLPPERRPVGVVFQDYLLFPHLTVLENVAFGLRSRGTRRAAARQVARTALDRAGLGEMADARPGTLSGGQSQRVALARALATQPKLLLLDEPLSALDQGARGAVRRELRAQLASFPGVRLLVTHDPIDAAALADEMVILEAGRVVQRGTFATVSEAPRSRYVAELVGVNLFHGIGRGDHVELPGGARLAAPDAGAGEVLAVVHPRAVALHRAEPGGSPRNVLQGVVEHVEMLGDRARVRLRGPVPLVAEITPAAVRELGITEGATLWSAVKATDVTVYPA
jgi:molybdate transport system ATP-binding protein